MSVGLLYSQCKGFNKGVVGSICVGVLCSLCQLGLLYSQCLSSSRGAVGRVRDGVLNSQCQLG